MRASASLAAVVAAIAVAGASPGPARADDVADFYQGKTVEIVVGLSAGGLYSTFAQLIAEHLGKHIPGKPQVVVNHMPGAGGLKADNYVANVAPKDGTTLETPSTDVVKRALLETDNVRYDPREFNWLGAWGEPVFVCTLLKPGAVSGYEEARKTEVVLGATSPDSKIGYMPRLLNDLDGAKFKIITGYGGGSPIRLAMEKGEVDGWCGQYVGWKIGKPDWIRDDKLLHLVQFATKKHPEMPDVPLYSDVVTDEEALKVFAFLSNGLTERTFAAPPGVPEDRVVALREAYAALLKDPAFVSKAEELGFTIDPVSGEQIAETVDELMSTSPEQIEKIKTALGGG